MIKNIKSLDGIEILTKEQQKATSGGMKKRCLLPNGVCLEISIACAELKCQPVHPA